MNPLMTEAQIINLIDKAVERRRSIDDGESTFITIRINLFPNRWRDFSAIETMRWEKDGTPEELPSLLFELQLHQCYISNVKMYSKNTLFVNLKRGMYGRDSNFGSDTIDKLLSVMRKEN